MPKAPKQQLYNAVFVGSLRAGFFTVDSQDSTNESNPYPFVHVGEVIGSDIRDNKDVIRGDFTITLHVWALANDRGAFSQMTFDLEMMLRRLYQMDGFTVKNTDINSNELIDTSTDDRLLHGIINADFQTN